jgi:DNA-binding transcriptional LysR family regulator
MTNFSFRELECFLAVAEELSFTRAAERLHLAQPPLSRHIRQLEEKLGIELFQRSRRKVSITAAGKAFREEAQEILAAFDGQEMPLNEPPPARRSISTLDLSAQFSRRNWSNSSASFEMPIPIPGSTFMTDFLPNRFKNSRTEISILGSSGLLQKSFLEM